MALGVALIGFVFLTYVLRHARRRRIVRWLSNAVVRCKFIDAFACHKLLTAMFPNGQIWCMHVLAFSVYPTVCVLPRFMFCVSGT